MPEPGRRRWFGRIGWLVLFWLLGVAAAGAVALVLRALMRTAGLGS